MLTDIEIQFNAKLCQDKLPRIKWNFRDYSHEQAMMGSSTAGFKLDLAEGPHIIRFEFINKTNEDTTQDQDLAVIIEDIRINGVSDEKIFNHTVYKPKYPEPWFSEQQEKPKTELYAHRYLGWNGTWELEFSVPAFEWLHQTMGFGWHY